MAIVGISIIENSGVCWQGTIFGDGLGLLSREYIWLHGTSFKYNDSNYSMDHKTYFTLAYGWKELIDKLIYLVGKNKDHS
jgi:hypothetical protein